MYFDTPHDFLKLANDRNAGGAWIQLHRDAQDDEHLAEQAEWVNAKIPYSWVTLGDWTLRRRY